MPEVRTINRLLRELRSLEDLNLLIPLFERNIYDIRDILGNEDVEELQRQLAMTALAPMMSSDENATKAKEAMGLSYAQTRDRLIAGLEHRKAEMKTKKDQKGVLDGRAVFVGHGRNKLWGILQLYLEKELGVDTISYESESRTGKSISTILEEILDRSSFAVILMTAEDETGKGTTRARQNVVHEIGLFQGRIGFTRVAILKQTGVEEFSNIAGLQYIPFDRDSIEMTFLELSRALRREGLIAQVAEAAPG